MQEKMLFVCVASYHVLLKLKSTPTQLKIERGKRPFSA
jgi:hypothetical protein